MKTKKSKARTKKTTRPYGAAARPSAVSKRLRELETGQQKLWEVSMQPGTLEGEREDLGMVRASSVATAARKFCAKKGVELGPQTGEYEPGERGSRAAFRAKKDWGLFGGVVQYSVFVKEADIIE